MADRAVSFNRSMAPYESGDIAGFPSDRAEDLVARGIADFYPTVVSAPPTPVIDVLTDMDRAALVAFGKEHLGMLDEPPAGVSDNDLRAAIRASADPAILVIPTEPPAASPPAPFGKSSKKA